MMATVAKIITICLSEGLLDWSGYYNIRSVYSTATYSGLSDQQVGANIIMLQSIRMNTAYMGNEFSQGFV